MPVDWAIEQGFLTAFSFISFLLVTVTASAFFKAPLKNCGALLYLFWTASLSLIQFINHIMWRDNAIDFAPGWCDFSIRITYAGKIGIIAAGLVIARRLCLIVNRPNLSSKDRAVQVRTAIQDLTIGLSFPLAQFVIYWFVQGHRYDIFEGVGCLSALPNTVLLAVLYTAWPIPIGIASAVYCWFTLQGFLANRDNWKGLENLRRRNQYYRLMAMAALEMICTVPLATFNVVSTMTAEIYPWRGLGDLHLGFERVRQYPLEIWTTQFGDFRSTVESNEWMVIACGIVFFCLFNFSQDAQMRYYRFYTTVAQRVGFSTISGRTTTTGPNTTNGVISSSFGHPSRSVYDNQGSHLQIDLEKAAPYSSSEVTGDSSSSIRTPIDEKDPSLNEKGSVQNLEITEVPRAPLALDITSARRHSAPPDVPLTARHSFDMV